MCDRHQVQRNAIVRVFGEHVNVVHCCVHVARNIQRNTGMRSDLLSLFWAMRYTRTEESERAFINALERLHNTKHSMFTTHLMTSLDTFVPSLIRDALDIELFPELEVLGQFDTTRFVLDSTIKTRAARLLETLSSVGCLKRDLFSLDNTNTIEGYFKTIKSRTPLNVSTLLDIFAAVTFTEQAALASNHPASMKIPTSLVECLATVVSRGVIAVLSSLGVHSLLSRVVVSGLNILSDQQPSDDAQLNIIQQHLASGTIIDSFKWMPDDWLLSLVEPTTTHDVLNVNARFLSNRQTS